MKNNIVLFIAILSLGIVGCSVAATVIKKEETKAPFDGTRFDNIEPFKDKSFLTVLKWRLFGKRENWESVADQVFYKPAFQRSKKLKMTMIGHSTVLIQVDNLNILTDPHYSKRASPVSWAGPKRVIKLSLIHI